MKKIHWNVQKSAIAKGITTQTELADLCGIAKSTIGLVWRGTASRVDILTLRRLCHHLDCKVDDILKIYKKTEDEEHAN